MQRKTDTADARHRPPADPSKARVARAAVSRALRFRVLATAIATLGATIATVAFVAARDPLVARVAGASHGVPALVVLLAFTAIAVVVVVHYGRHSARLTVAYHDLHRATLQRERSEAALRESERFVRATLDAVDVMMAVLDADGVVLAVNRAWRRCGDELVGHDGSCDVGANYVAHCESVVGARAATAHRIAAGLREVMAGTRDGFVLERPMPDDARRLLTHVARFPGHGPLRLVVAHQHVMLEEPVAPPRDVVASSEDALAPSPEAPSTRDGPTPAAEPPDRDARLTALAEAMPVGVFLTDAHGANAYTNPGWHRITGIARDGGLGRAWIASVHADDRARVEEALRLLVERDSAVDAEFRVRTAADDVRWVHVLAKPLDERFVGVVLDVTACHASEERMRAVAAELAERVEARTRERDRFFGLSRDLLCVANATHLAMVNPAFTEALGYDAEALLARPYLELVHPEDRAATRECAERLAAGQPVAHLTNRCRHRDGSWRRIAWTAAAESADVVFASGRDVTERELARRELARVAGELRDVYDGAPCGYHALDADGVFVAVNDTELAWLGRAREDVVGRRRFADLLVAESRPVLAAAVDRLHATGRVADVELDVVRRDGRVLPIALTATAVRDDDGRVVGSRASIVDVTERRGAAERVAALRAALAARTRELDATTRELDALSHSVSHHLRPPLHAIDDVARTLDDQHVELGVDGRRQLGVIRESAGRMAHLIDGLAALGRIGRAPLRRTPVDMARLVGTVVAEVRRAHPAREVTVEVGALAPAFGDADELRHAITQLVANAFESTAGVAHPCIDVGGVEHDATVVYYVRDNGVGFDADRAAALFETFPRRSAPDGLDGAGIGLAIVRRVIERHGGRAWAEGRVGEGATFFFTLGGQPPAGAEAEPVAEGARTGEADSTVRADAVPAAAADATPSA